MPQIHDFQSGAPAPTPAWRRWALGLATVAAATTWAWAAMPLWGQSEGTAPAANRVRSVDRTSRDRIDKARFREGTAVVDLIGTIQVEGDSATVLGKDDVELGGLPNLNLERIVRTLKTVSEPEDVQWSISGVVTEYGGRNYILISRAVYKASSAVAAE